MNGIFIKEINGKICYTDEKGNVIISGDDMEEISKGNTRASRFTDKVGVSMSNDSTNFKIDKNGMKVKSKRRR